MSPIKLGTNVSSLLVQRNLATVTSNLQTNFQRLSSGLRINSAKDDAAALALGTKLKADTLIYAQAIRNVNEGISLTNISEAALRELDSILVRQMELAEQAANSTSSSDQRSALQTEMDLLTDEFNRIVSSTKMNDISLLSAQSFDLSIQAGAKSGDAISIAIASELSWTVGDGTFAASQSYAMGYTSNYAVAADLDNDGALDVISGAYLGKSLNVVMGNGDGTFLAQASYSVGENIRKLELGDYNGDGYLDVATANNNAQEIGIFLGNGDGTFKVMTTFESGVGSTALSSGDFDGDGLLDIAYGDYANGNIQIAFGNGNGTFSVGSSFYVGTQTASLITTDMDGDGRDDLVATSLFDDTVSVLSGNGDGSFAVHTFAAPGVDPDQPLVFDANRDGVMDILFTETGTGPQIRVMLGNKDGTFAVGSSQLIGDSAGGNTFNDFNGDGYLDLAQQNGLEDTVSVLLGRGDGTFASRISYSVGSRPTRGLISEDFNNDGVIDLLTSNSLSNNIHVLLGNTKQTTEAAHHTISTVDKALESLTELSNIRERVSAELGTIGAAQTRFAHAVSYLQTIRTTSEEAYSRIMEADIAQEAAELVKNQIIQQAAAAVLAQANQEPTLILTLLT